MEKETPTVEEWESRFDEKFGKARDDGGYGSIGREAGCDDCPTSVELREEHKSFIRSLLSSHDAELRQKIEGMTTTDCDEHDHISREEVLALLTKENV